MSWQGDDTNALVKSPCMINVIYVTVTASSDRRSYIALHSSRVHCLIIAVYYHGCHSEAMGDSQVLSQY